MPMAPLTGCRTPSSAHSHQSLMEEAKKKGWVVISMKDDWKRIFAFDP